MKTWNKATEKKVLLDLIKGDTYFAATFDMGQYDIMARNIDNDFPLLAGTIADPDEIRQLKDDVTLFQDKEYATKQELIEARNDHKAEVRHLKWTIDVLLLKIFRHNQTWDEKIEIEPTDFEFEGKTDLTMEEIVRLKFNNRIPWDDADIAFIMEQIKKP